tara:strand:+ start:253 stop:549 length:297 start_codon:yes stop_codon:yes gene_type:complete
MKLNKKLKDPNEKSAIQKFVGGKIPHYLAVAAFAWVLLDVVSFTHSVITNRPERERNELNQYIDKQIVDSINKALPPITGFVTGPVSKPEPKKNGNGQ